MSKQKKINRRVRLALSRPKVKKTISTQVDTIGLFKRFAEIAKNNSINFRGQGNNPFRSGLEAILLQPLPPEGIGKCLKLSFQHGKTRTLESMINGKIGRVMSKEESIIFMDKLTSSIPLQKGKARVMSRQEFRDYNLISLLSQADFKVDDE